MLRWHAFIRHELSNKRQRLIMNWLSDFTMNPVKEHSIVTYEVRSDWRSSLRHAVRSINTC
jgi:hypothetical protein